MRIIEDYMATKINKKIPFEKEFYPLLTRLVKNDIPFDIRRIFDGFQLIYPNIENQVCDVVIHMGSYGVIDGTLEIMGLNDNEDNVDGYLHEYEVFDKIFNHYIKNRGN